MSIFPFIQPDLAAEETGLPLYVDVQWDFEAHRPVYEAGEPVLVSGLPAVLGWAARALLTPRFTSAVYSRAYGNGAHALLGKEWIYETKRAEAERHVRRCLQASPYIKEAAGMEVEFDGGLLKVSCTVLTVYGPGRLEVEANV